MRQPHTFLLTVHWPDGTYSRWPYWCFIGFSRAGDQATLDSWDNLNSTLCLTSIHAPTFIP